MSIRISADSLRQKAIEAMKLLDADGFAIGGNEGSIAITLTFDHEPDVADCVDTMIEAAERLLNECDVVPPLVHQRDAVYALSAAVAMVREARGLSGCAVAKTR